MEEKIKRYWEIIKDGKLEMLIEEYREHRNGKPIITIIPKKGNWYIQWDAIAKSLTIKPVDTSINELRRWWLNGCLITERCGGLQFPSGKEMLTVDTYEIYYTPKWYD